MPTFGVKVDDETKAYLEERRQRPDPETGAPEIISRSKAIRELIRLGRAADELIENSELDLEHGRAREAFIRQAVLNELSREGLDDPREE